MRRKPQPVESQTFAGMETAVELQAEAAAEYQGGELTEKLLEPLGNINARTGKMEMESPLFAGTIHPTLF